MAFASTGSFHSLQNNFLKFLRCGLRAEAPDHLTIAIEQKLGKVPRDVGVAFFISAGFFEHVVKFTGLAAVDIYLAENRKIRLILAFGEFQNFLIGARFLSPELIAGKG